MQCAVAVRVLQREGAQEEAADQQPGSGQHEEAAGQHRPSAEQADGEQRTADPAPGQGEGCPYRDGEHEREHRGRGGPAVAAGVDQAVDRGGGSGGDQHRTRDVEAPLRRVRPRPGGHDQRDRDEQGGPDRHVDGEHPPPARFGREDAAEDDAQRRSGARQRRPHAERLAAVRAGEQGHHRGQRGRGHQRRASALQRPPGE